MQFRTEQEVAVIGYSGYLRPEISHAKTKAAFEFGLQYKLIFNRNFALRFTSEIFSDYFTWSSPPDPGNGEYSRHYHSALGIEKYFAKGSKTQPYLLLDVERGQTGQSVINYNWYYTFPHYGAYILHDSSITYIQNYATYGLMGGAGIKLLSSSGLFMAVEASMGLSRFFQKGTATTHVHYYDSYTKTGYAYYKPVVALPRTGTVFIANYARLTVGMIF